MRSLRLLLPLLLLGCQGASGTIYLGGSSASSGPAPPPPPPPGTGAPLGINIGGIAYYDPGQPFLNLVKMGGASNGQSNIGWYTSNSSTWDTGEEAYLQLDSNGYVTSLTASPTPSAGQKFTFIKTLLDYNLPGGGGTGAYPIGAPTVYPAGQYRLKYEGQGTVTTTGGGGDGSIASGDTCPVTGLSNSASDTYVSCTFHVTSPGSNGGIILEISAITSATDYPRNISVVRESEASAYDGGAIFDPNFLAAVANFSSVRLMNWSQVNSEFCGGNQCGFNLAAPLAQGAVSGVLTVNWTEPSGAYEVIFVDGEIRTANFVLGSPAFNWSTGLANAISSNTFGNTTTSWLWVDELPSFASRPLPSNAFWGLAGGVPLEISVALANQLNAAPWINIPLLYGAADIESVANLVISGSGMQSGYSALSSSLDVYFERSNEIWNGGSFQQGTIAGILGGSTWPTAPAGGGNAQWNYNYNGYQAALMASDLQSATGTSFSRVIPVLGSQAGSGSAYTASQALVTPDWSGGPASNYPIKAVAIAPYWGNNLSDADCTTMTGVANPLDDFFATLTSGTGTAANGSHTYSSIPSNGWLGEAEGQIETYISFMKSYPSIALIAYEGGQNFYAQAGQCAGWTALVTSAERDPRMGSAYTSYLDYWATDVGATSSNINELFSDISPIDQYGAWGLIENPLQPLSPLSSAPYKWQAVETYMQ